MIDVTLAFAAVEEHWRPKIVAEANGQMIRVVKTQGVFPWHAHADADETFLVHKGCFRVEFRDRVVELAPGQLLVVPAGVEHRTASDGEAEVLVISPKHWRNTGDIDDAVFTAPSDARLSG